MMSSRFLVLFPKKLYALPPTSGHYIVNFPQVVREALRKFDDLLPKEPQRRHLAEYLTGLFVVERKNVSAINREFAQTTDPSAEFF